MERLLSPPGIHVNTKGKVSGSINCFIVDSDEGQRDPIVGIPVGHGPHFNNDIIIWSNSVHLQTNVEIQPLIMINFHTI